MDDTALYVSLGANALLAVSQFAKAFKTQAESQASVINDLSKRLQKLEEENGVLERRVDHLEQENMELMRAKDEALTYARALEAANAKLTEANKRSEALYREVRQMYREVTGTHQGISIPPPKLEDP